MISFILKLNLAQNRENSKGHNYKNITMRISKNIALSQKTRNELKFLQQAMNKGYLKSSPKTRKSYKYL